ncbi:reverse transcriptase domain-containing protein [Tanacetum coccineum]
MSSPDHPTANLEDVFSSNFPNYVPPASPDYIPTSPGKTYSSASNSFGIVPLTSPTLSLFPDDPYMKALQAFYTEKSPIPLIETSRKSAIKRHEEQIQGIQCYLEEIPPERFEQIENGIEGLGKGTIIIQRDFDALAAELQASPYLRSLTRRKQIGSKRRFISCYRTRNWQKSSMLWKLNAPKRHQQRNAPAMIKSIRKFVADSVTSALESQAATWQICAEENKVTFATGTLTDDALSWWNAYAQPMGIEQANQITWTELKRLLTNKYCPRTEIRKMEEELYNLIVKGNDLKPYVRRFQELTVLCPNMVPNNEKLLEAFIGGLHRSIEGNVTASKPQTLEEAINIAQRLMDQVTKHTPMQVSSNNKRKFGDKITFNNNSRSNNYRNTNNRYNNRQQQNRRQEAGRAYAVTPSENSRYAGDLPLCKRCNFHHIRPCTGKCNICNKVGHLSKN